MEQLRRKSKKREAMLRLLQGCDSHPSAEWIYDRLKGEFPDISLGTVYRNLALFRENRQVRSVAVVNGVERYDANTAFHPHFVCRVCGSVYDVEIAEDHAASLKSAGYTVEACDITYFGICPGCNENADN